jgi:thiamine pyrophosphate-dependent acetolactate synthase large subunit-like protein
MMLSRQAATEAVLSALRGDELAVFANGYVSRDGHAIRHSPRNFYMLGSMGLAAAIGLGICLARDDAHVVVFDADGNLLMGLGVLPMAGAWQPRSFLHVVLDNGTYASTGGQETVAPAVDFPAAALACGYGRAASAATAAELAGTVRAWAGADGPSLLHVTIDPEEGPLAPRVSEEPPAIAARFAAAARR